MKFNLSIQELKEKESKVFSQSNQDGIIEAIFQQIGEGGKYFVDIGARDGLDISNTANLRLNKQWSGLLIDSEPSSSIVKKFFITKDNINYILFKNAVPNIDLLTLDTDGNEIWLIKELSVMPRVIVIEFNSKFDNNTSVAIEYNEAHIWAGDDYYGASLLALKRVLERKGYTLVYVLNELDAFFIRNDLLSSEYKSYSLDKLFPNPIVAHQVVSNKKWVEIE